MAQESFFRAMRVISPADYSQSNHEARANTLSSCPKNHKNKEQVAIW